MRHRTNIRDQVAQYAQAMQSLNSQCRGAATERISVRPGHCPPHHPSLTFHWRLPPTLRTRPWRLLRAYARARRALLNMRLRNASRAIAEIDDMLSACDPTHRVRYEPALAELRAAVLVAKDDLPRARELLAACSQTARDGSLSTTLLRYLDWVRGEAAELPEPEHHPSSPEHHIGGTCERILALSVNAALEFEHLRPIVAANLASEAMRMVNERYGATSSLGAFPAVLLAQIAYEQGRLGEAEALVRPRLAAILSRGTLECVLRAGVLLARISMYRGRSADALACLRDAKAVARKRGWPRLLSALRVEQARMLSATACPTARPSASVCAQEDPTRALADVHVVPRYSSVHGALSRLASSSSPLNTEARYSILLSCLRIGATRGLYRLFVDAGAPILGLLGTLCQERPHMVQALDVRTYIGLLLRAAAPSTLPPHPPIAHSHPPLSRREQAILAMIAQGLSNKRIAQSLGIAPETVKSHNKSIFFKLGTSTRAQAAARGASMAIS
jgi:LuxR family transcriptional regulator, maltose regulon positive regulatory protein